MSNFRYSFNFDTQTIIDEICLDCRIEDISTQEDIILSVIQKRFDSIERSLEYFASELDAKLEDIDNRLWRVEDKTQ